MKISFTTIYDSKNEVAGKYYIEIPANLWQVFGQKGRIKTECMINGFSHMTTLIPKGQGRYVYQLTKKTMTKIKLDQGQALQIELCKINPSDDLETKAMSKEQIDQIRFLEQKTPYSCGQTCLAMLLNKNIDEIFDLVGKRPLAIGKMVETLNALAVKTAQKNIRISKKNPQPSPLSLVTLKKENGYHYVLYKNGLYYDPSRGILNETPEGMTLSSYLEIYTEDM